jgi:hypothetical protein
VIVPLTIAEANEVVRRWHRHHNPTLGGKWALGWSVDGEIVAAAIVGRPVARHLDDGWTLEVTRLVSNGAPNACSALYASAWRAARAMGYRRMVTYTLATEKGVSLRAAGWRVVGEVKGRSWHTPSRPRVDKHPTLDKVRWEAGAEQ